MLELCIRYVNFMNFILDYVGSLHSLINGLDFCVWLSVRAFVDWIGWIGYEFDVFMFE